MQYKADHSPKKKGLKVLSILNNDLTIVSCVYEPFNITTWCVVIAFISELIDVN